MVTQKMLRKHDGKIGLFGVKIQYKLIKNVNEIINKERGEKIDKKEME